MISHNPIYKTKDNNVWLVQVASIRDAPPLKVVHHPECHCDGLRTVDNHRVILPDMLPDAAITDEADTALDVQIKDVICVDGIEGVVLDVYPDRDHPFLISWLDDPTEVQKWSEDELEKAGVEYVERGGKRRYEAGEDFR